MSERYMVISSDCHAGLPNEEYRPYLDPQYRDAFDVFLAEREAARQQFAIMGNKEFEDEWFSENEEGLRGGWDAERRDKELDADGVVGEVIFPDADAVLGGASAPFGAGLGMSSQTDPELLMAGARAHNRWLAELCNDSPERRRGVALVPIHHEVDAAVTARMLGLAAAELRGFDVPALAPLADRIGPSPADLGQTSPEADAARAKWDDLRDAGRPWVTCVEAIPVGTKTTRVF